MNYSANALCAKAKAMYGNRLNEEIYDDLSRKQTIGEVVTYLKSQTSYKDVLKDINVRNVHRGQIEQALSKEYYNRATRLMKYAPANDRDFYLYEIVGVEIRLIIDKLMSLRLQEGSTYSLEIPDYLTNKTSFNVYGLINVESFKDLVSYLRKTRYYDVLKNYNLEGDIDINSIQHELTRLYYDLTIEAIKKKFKGSLQKDLLNIIYTAIELGNITKVYRFKKYFHESPESIRKTLFLDYTRLSKEMVEQLINASGASEFMTLLSSSKYHVYVDDKNFEYIEYYVESIKYNIAKRYMRFSGDAPLVYMTYCILQKVEVDNLKHIIEGIRYNRDASSIQSTLIYA